MEEKTKKKRKKRTSLSYLAISHDSLCHTLPQPPPAPPSLSIACLFLDHFVPHVSSFLSSSSVSFYVSLSRSSSFTRGHSHSSSLTLHVESRNDLPIYLFIYMYIFITINLHLTRNFFFLFNMDYHSLGSMCVPFPYRVSFFFLLSASEYSGLCVSLCVCESLSLSLPPSFSFYNSLSFAFVITFSKKRFFRPIEKSNSVIENAVEIRGTLNLNESTVHRLK